MGEVLLPGLGVFTGIIVVLIGVFKFNREEQDAVVARTTQILDAQERRTTATLDRMQLLNDELIESLERCRNERVALEVAIRDLKTELARKDDEQRLLEARLRRAQRRDG